jgi:transcription antitermination factor NusG
MAQRHQIINSAPPDDPPVVIGLEDFPDEIGLAWYVLHVVSTYEQIVGRCLTELGLEYIRFTELRKRPRKKALVVAVFPGYLFVKFGVSGLRWRYIHTISGVISILGDEEGNPTALPEEIIERLRAERDDRSEDNDREWVPPWEPGEKLRVLAGPFANFTASYVGYTGSHIHAFVHIFGRSTLAIFNPTDLEAVAKAK